MKEKLSNESEASALLTRFEKVPDENRAPLESILSRKLREDSAFKDQISDLVKTLGPIVDSTQKVKQADEVRALEANELERGKVRIDQEVENAKKVEGAKFGKIG